MASKDTRTERRTMAVSFSGLTGLSGAFYRIVAEMLNATRDFRTNLVDENPIPSGYDDGRAEGQNKE
jgi:hypothetical protein